MNDLTLAIKLTADGRILKGEVRASRDEFEKLNRELGNSKSASRKAQTGLDRTAKSAKGLKHETDNLGSSLKKVGTIAAGAWAALQIGNQTQKLVATVAQYQNMELRLENLSGTAAAYAENEIYLIELADQHHKSLFTLGDSYTRILALEKASILTRQEGRQILEGMSNAASSLGASNTQLEQSLFGMAQGFSAGTLRAEELNQVTEPLPGLLQELDRAAGVTSGGFRRLVNDGEVTSAMFKETLVKALEAYQGAAAATADNLTAKYQDIGNAYIQLAAELEKPISDALTPVLDGMVTSLKFVTENSAQVVTGLKALGVGFGVYVLAKTFGLTLKNLTTNLYANVSALASTQIQTNAYGQVLARTTALTRTASAATGVLRTGLAFLAGPAGIAIMAGAALFAFSGDADIATESADELAIKLAQATGDMKALDHATRTKNLNDYRLQLKSLGEEVKSKLSFFGGIADNLRKIGGADVQGEFSELGRQIALLTELIKQEEKALAELNDTQNETNDGQSTGSDTAGELSKAQQKLIDLYQPAQSKLEKYNEAQQKLQALQKKHPEALDDISAALANLGTLIDEENKRIRDQADAEENLLEAMEREYELMLMGERQRYIQIQLRKADKDTTDEQLAAIVELAGKMYDLETAQRAATKAAKDAEKQANPWADAWKEAGNRVDETFADIWTGAFDSFSDFGDRLLDGFKAMLAEMAHLALTRPIIVPIMNSIGQAAGLPVEGVTDVAGGFDTSLTNLTNLFTGNGIGAGIESAGNWLANTTGIGANGSAGLMNNVAAIKNGDMMMTTNGGSFAGAGQYSNMSYGLASIAGSFVGDMFGNENGQYGSTGGSLGATIGMSFGPIGAAIGALLGGLVGSFIGPGAKDPQATFTEGATDSIYGQSQSAFGTYGFTSHEDMGEEMLSGLQQLVTGMVELDNLVASLRTPEQVDAIKAALEGFESDDFENLFTDRIKIILSASESVFTDMLLQVNDPEKLATALATGLQLENVMTLFGDQVQMDVTTELEKYAGSTRFQGAIDAMTQGLAALGVLTDSLSVLNLKFDVTAGGAVHAARELGLIVGGFENLAAMQSNYYGLFFSDAEKHRLFTEQLGESYDSLNLSLPRSKQGFRDLIEAQDLNTEAGRETYAALLGLASGTNQYLSALVNQSQSITGAYNEILGRQPDTSGLEFYLGQLESGAKTLDQVLAEIANSPEAAAVALERLVSGSQNSINTLLDSWLTDDQRLAGAQGELDAFNTVLGLVGLSAIDTRSEMKTYLLSLDLTTESGRTAASTALDLADAIEQVEDASTGAFSAENRLAAARSDLVSSLETEIDRENSALDTLQSNLTEAESAYRGALSNQINALRTEESRLGRELTAAKSSYTSAIRSEISAIQAQVNAQRSAREEALQTAEQWREAATTLADARLGMLSTAIDPRGSVGIAEAQFNQSLQGAWAGDLDALNRLPGLANDYLSAFSGQASSGMEYRAMAAQISAQLQGAESLAETQASREDIAADIAAESLLQLEGQIVRLDAQLAGITGIQEASLSIYAAADQYYKAQEAYQAADFGTRIDYYQEQLDALDSVSDDLENLDAARSAYETSALALSRSHHNSNISLMRSQLSALGQVDQSVRALPDALKAYLGLGGQELPKFKNGGIASGPLSGYNVELHGTELILPMNGSSIPVKSGNSELVSEIKSLKQVMSVFIDDNRLQRGAQISATLKIARFLEKWDVDDLPKQRTA